MGPETSLKYPFTPHYSHPWALVHKTTYAPLIHMSLNVMIFDACRYMTRASGRGWGNGNLKFFGPQMALAFRLDTISQGPKNSFPGPNPLPLALMDLHASETLHTGRIHHRGINSY
jgi:hypothetical protein